VIGPPWHPEESRQNAPESQVPRRPAAKRAREELPSAVLDAPLAVAECHGGGEVMEYKARCHCGRVRFSFRSSEIKTGARCNCSLCIRRGAVLSSTYIPAADFTPHYDLRDLDVYLWNEKVLSNYFCKTCGIFTYISDGENAKDGYRVNLGCVEGLDPLALEINIIDGKSVPLIEEPG
jgi:hypothetical protein